MLFQAVAMDFPYFQVLIAFDTTKIRRLKILQFIAHSLTSSEISGIAYLRSSTVVVIYHMMHGIVQDKTHSSLNFHCLPSPQYQTVKTTPTTSIHKFYLSEKIYFKFQ